MKNKLIKLVSVYHEKGASGLYRSLILYFYDNIFSYNIETYYVFRVNLAITVYAKTESNDVIKIDSNNILQVKQLVQFWPLYYRQSKSNDEIMMDIYSRFNDGDECFACINKGKIIAMGWIGYTNNYMLKGVAKKIGLKKDEAISHFYYVDDAHRGKGIQILLKNYIYSYIKEEKDLKTAYTYVGVHNIASLINNIKINQEYRILHHISITFMCFDFNLYPKYKIERWLNSLTQL